MENEKGFSLLEVLLAVALLGIIVVAFLGGLATASKVSSMADERATAESLARSQMEFVRSQAYSSAPWDYTLTSLTRNSTDPPLPWYDANKNPPLLASNYAGYIAEVKTVLVHTTDDGLQKIIVVVKFPSYDAVKYPNRKFTLEGYRSTR